MYYTYKQESGESNTKHLRDFKSIVSAVKHLGGILLSDEISIKIEKEVVNKSNVVNKTDMEYKIIVKKKMMGVAFLKRADKQRYSKLMTNIRDQHSF